MLLKRVDDRYPELARLEASVKAAAPDRRDAAALELRRYRAGIQAECETADLIDFEYAKSVDMVVIHGLRLDFEGRNAQIDHLLIHRSLYCFVLESRHVQSGVRITETGEFLRWNDRRRSFDGMASPLARNERHISVLRDVFQSILPRFSGGRAPAPVFRSLVVVPCRARVDRPSGFDTSRVVKADLLRGAIKKDLAEVGEADLISGKSLEELGRHLVALHRPAAFSQGAGAGTAGEAGRLADPNSPAEWTLESLAVPESTVQRGSGHSLGPLVGRVAAGMVLLVALAAGAVWLKTFLWGQMPSFAERVPKVPVLTPAVTAPEPSSVEPPPAAPAISKPEPGRAPTANTLPEAGTPSSTPDRPAVRVDARSLTATGKAGRPVAEIQGDLPRIREEMRESGLGVRPLNPGRAEPPVCNPGAVMTDAEIAACRQMAGRQP